MKKINRNFFKPFMFICLGLMAVMLMSAAYTPPGAPRNLKIVSVGKDKCTISFTSPRDDGGSPIQGYIISYKYKGNSLWVRAFPKVLVLAYQVTIPYLTEGKEVQFRVSAVSTEAGEGPPCRSSDFILLK